MATTSGLPPVAATASSSARLRAEPAAGAVDFAGLVGPIVNGAAAPAPAAAAEGLVDAETPGDDVEFDDREPGPPPLLNWLFGLMAFTGAGLPPPGREPVEGAAADSEALPQAATATATPWPLQTGVPAAALATVAANDPVQGADPHTFPGPSQTPDHAVDLHLPADAMAVAEAAFATAADADAAAAAAAADGEPATPGAARPDAREASELFTPAFETAAMEQPADAAQMRSPQADATLLSPAAANHVHRSAPSIAPAAFGSALSLLAGDFVPDLGERIEWQLADGIGEATIELHPAELGALTVRIETQGDQTRVHIVAAEAATRSLLSQAMPQLRELLAGSGLNLARGQVEASARREERSADRSSAAHATPGARRRITQILLVDAYA